MFRCFLVLFVCLWASCGCSEGPAVGGGPVTSGGDAGKKAEFPAFSVVTGAYSDGALLSVTSDLDGTVWTVGGEKGRAIALTWDGAAWQRRDPPLQQQLWWVSTLADGAVVVVGESGSVALYAEATWTVIPTADSGATYYGAWGSSAADFWVVGGPWARAAKGAATQKRVLRHFDGKQWTATNVDALLPKTAQSVFKVWGRNASDVFAVGDGGAVLHYDGKSWRAEDSQLVGVVLFTVTGTADRVWAIGGFGSPQLIARSTPDNRTGTRNRNAEKPWSAVELADEVPATLQGISVQGAGDAAVVWVSGWDGYVASYSAGIWTSHKSGTELALHAVHVDGSGAVWAVGGDIQTLTDDHVGAISVAGATVAKLP